MGRHYPPACAFVQAFAVGEAQSHAMRTFELLTALGLLAACNAGARGAGPAATATFGWIAGDWCLESPGELIEEHWLPAQGDLMLGLGRTVKGGSTASFEFLRIESKDGVANYLAQPQGAPPTAFKLTASGPNWARFENPQHDFPKRVEYRRTASGLHAEIAGPGEGGKDFVIPFDYEPCR
jgi:hypothetical protein